MDGYNVNTNVFNFGNYDTDPYTLYQPQLNLDTLNTRSSSVGSYQTSATPNSVDDLSEHSQLEQTFSSVVQSAPNEGTQLYETQWAQPFLNTHCNGYYPQSTTAIAPYIRGYAPHWATMGNFMMENPWYRYNQTYLPVNLQQEEETGSETTWPDNSSNSTTFDGAIKQENTDLCSENLTGEFQPEYLGSQSGDHFINSQTQKLLSSPSQSSSIPLNVLMMQTKKETSSNTSPSTRQTKSSGKRKGKTVFTYEQRAILEKEFREGNHYLEKNKRIALAKKLQLDEKNVRVWFQNRRVKVKREKEKEFIRHIQNSKVESSPTSNSSCSKKMYSYETEANRSLEDDTEDNLENL